MLLNIMHSFGHRLFIFALFLPTMVALPLSLAHADEARLAVLEFEGERAEETTLRMVTDAVRLGALDDLNGRGVDVMTRENVLSLLKTTGKRACIEGECQIETARNIGADFVVFGTVAWIEGRYVVTLKLHNCSDGSLLGTQLVRSQTQGELLNSLRERARDLVGTYLRPNLSNSAGRQGTATSAVAEPPPPPPPLAAVATVADPDGPMAPSPQGESPATAPVPPAFASPVTATVVPASDTAEGRPHRVWMWISTIAGLTGVTVGVVSGVTLLEKKKQLDDSGACNPTTRQCDSSQHETLMTYNSLRPVCTAGFVVGAVGLGLGLTLLLVEPAKGRPTVEASLGPATAVLKGTF